MSPLRRPPATLDEIVNAELESRRILQRQVAELTGSVDGASGLTSLIDGALGRVGAVETDVAGIDATNAALAARIAVLESLLTPAAGCRAYKNSNLSIPNDGAAHKISFDTVGNDFDGTMLTALPDVTITRTGYYIVAVCVQFAANATGDRTLDLYLGSPTTLIKRQEQRATSSGTCTLTLTDVVGIIAPEILTVWVTQSAVDATPAPVAINVLSSADFSPNISVVRVFRG